MPPYYVDSYGQFDPSSKFVEKIPELQLQCILVETYGAIPPPIGPYNLNIMFFQVKSDKEPNDITDKLYKAIEWLTHKTEVHYKIKLLIEPGRNDQDNIRYDSYKSFMKIISYPMSSFNA